MRGARGGVGVDRGGGMDGGAGKKAEWWDCIASCRDTEWIVDSPPQAEKFSPFQTRPFKKKYNRESWAEWILWVSETGHHPVPLCTFDLNSTHHAIRGGKCEMSVPIIVPAAAVVVSLPLVFRCRRFHSCRRPLLPSLLFGPSIALSKRRQRCSPALC